MFRGGRPRAVCDSRPPSGGWIAGSVPSPCSTGIQRPSQGKHKLAAAGTFTGIATATRTGQRRIIDQLCVRFARGPLLQPVHSTELVLSGPPRAHFVRGSARHRLARLTRQRSSSDSSFLPCPERPKEANHLPGGFPLGFSTKTLTPFQGEAPPGPRFPLGRRLRLGLTPFPHSCHGFCCSFVAAQTAPAPCVVKSSGGWGSLQRQARRKAEPGFRSCDPQREAQRPGTATRTARPTSRLCFALGLPLPFTPRENFLGGESACDSCP